MINYEVVSASSAFSGALKFDLETDAQLYAPSSAVRPELVPVVNPKHKLGEDQFRVISWIWNREHQRAVHEPRRGLWIYGPKGSGKTGFLDVFFGKLGVPLTPIMCSRRKPLADYLVKMVPDGEGGWMQVDGALLQAMKAGNPVVINEASSMTADDWISMHEIIDKGLFVTEDGEVVRAARGFIVFATDNTGGYGDETGSYDGVNEMNSATMRRFFKEEVDYMEEQEEVSVLQSIFADLPVDAIRNFVKFAGATRSAYKQGRSNVTLGTAELIEWIGMTKVFGHVAKSGRTPAWFTLRRVLGGAPVEFWISAEMNFKTYMGREITDADKAVR